FGPDLSQLSLHERLERWSPALTVVEETAQQWYYADLLDLAKLGELVIQPYSLTKEASVSYTAKVVTADQRFGGNVQYYYDEEGTPRYIDLNTSTVTDASPTASSRSHPGSFWYGDYKEIITEELEKYGEGPVPEDRVKLVALAHYTAQPLLNAVRVLYLQGERGDYLFMIPDEGDPKISIRPVDEELCAYAGKVYRAFLDYQEKQRQFREEHPDEFLAGGGAGSPKDNPDMDTPGEIGWGSIGSLDDPLDTDPDDPVPDTQPETGETESIEPDAPPAAELPAALAVTVAVCAVAVLAMVGALVFFRR
ncbi:MAG: hypothetical protein J6Z23_03340, partial [Lachnospiraceae bacterium]|nr:hypothetical protein [Lachnospiraceae bacterium]